MKRMLSLSIVAVLAASQTAAAEPAEKLTPTQADVKYGPHERNVLDFYAAEGQSPRPLLVYIHGGGWTSGDKRGRMPNFPEFLDQGISCAAINYRLSTQAPLPAPVHDAARAIQFLRSKADEWNINTDRIALTGGSAGACTSMWILLHDDLADPAADDPVKRESTRVAAAAVSAGQTSIDPKVVAEWVGPKILEHRMINLAVGEPTIAAALKNYEQHREHYIEFSPYNHVDGDDPPLFMTYGADATLPSKSAGHGIHHPVLGVKLKQKSAAVGHECHLVIGSRSSSDEYLNATQFLLDKLLAK